MIRFGENLLLTFRHPGAAAALLALAAAWWLLRLRRRWQARTYGTLQFWKRALQAGEWQTPRRAIVDVAALLAWTLIIGLATVAAMGPELTEAVPPKHCLLIFDTSLSMSVPDVDGRSRLEAAREAAAGYVRAAHPGAMFAIVRTAPYPRLLAGWSADRAAILTGLDSLAVCPDAGDLDAALTLADAWRIENSREIVFTDAAQGAKPERATADMVVINGGGANAGIADFTMVQDPYYLTYSGMLRVANPSRQAMSLSATIRAGERILEQPAWELPAGGEAAVVFELPLDVEGVLTAELRAGSAADGLALDDTARAYVPRRRHPRVVLVCPDEASLLAPALASVQEFLRFDQALRTTPEGFSSLREQLRDEDIVVFERCGPPAPLTRGCYLIFGAPEGAAGLPFTPGERFAPAALTLDNPGHAVVRFLALDRIVARSASRVEARPAMTVWLWSGNSPVLFLQEQEGLRVIGAALDLAESNWILLDSFPMFLANAIRYFSQPMHTGFAANYRTGEPVIPEAAFAGPVMVKRWWQEQWRESWTLSPAADGGVRFAETALPGDYYFQAGDTVLTPAIVNFNVTGESAVQAQWQGEGMPSPATPAVSWWVGRPLQRWLILSVFGLLLMEWGLYHLRWAARATPPAAKNPVATVDEGNGADGGARPAAV